MNNSTQINARILFCLVVLAILLLPCPQSTAGLLSKAGKAIFTTAKKALKEKKDEVAGAVKASRKFALKMGKNGFYGKAREALTSKGYKYFDGDKAIKGKGRAHRRKPDYVAEKGDHVIVGETKSPREPPTSGSWRKRQPNDSEAMAKVRADVAAREKAGQLNPEVGGHEIIVRGQIPDYAANAGKTYHMPVDTEGKKIMGGYTVDAKQAGNVEEALRNCGKRAKKIDNGNGSITYIFPV